MTDDKMISERDAVMRERDAFEAGAFAAHKAQMEARRICDDWGLYAWDRKTGSAFLKTGVLTEAVRERYPLPKVKRPRVVTDPHIEGVGDRYQWRIFNGVAQFRLVGESGRWFLPDGRDGGVFMPTAERVAMWTDLFANPTEEVDADD